MTELLFAVHRLGVSDPDVEMVATGEWNADGSPVMKKSTKRIDAGTLFPASLLEGGPAEIRRLIDLGAIRYPDATELALFERDQVEG
ncbi:hypothetical protein [Rhizorhapis sp.]|uniref:hypothetical protein n=1 Tax=Rhizorhapis sp. TaxID=1968842 RepID=UPI002B471DB0|nr:hypothetical protein [Rhizorhapis sp.]HKR16619.1 hypothetical protein [Rhizorhapis sp.]